MVTEPPIAVRRAGLDDVDGVASVRRSVAAEGVWIGTELPIDVDLDRSKHVDAIESMESGDGVLVLVADDGEEVVGWLVIRASVTGVGNLGMALLPESRGHGVGRRLLDVAVDWARSEGLHKLELQHWTWNLRARRLYDAVGFVEEGYLRRHYRRQDGSLWDAVIMGLLLDEARPGHDVRAAVPPATWPT